MNNADKGCMVKEKNEAFSLKSLSADVSIYYFTFILYVISYLIKYTNIDYGYSITVLHFVCLGMIIIKLLLQGFKTLMHLFLAGVLLALALLSFYSTNDRTILFLLLFILASDKIEIKSLATISLITVAIVMTLVVICSNLGIIDAVYQVRDGFGLRSSLGFSHPNRFGSNMLALAIAYAVIRFPIYKIIDIVIYSIISCIILIVSDSRTAAVSVVLVMALSAICSMCYGRKWQKALLIIMCCTFVAIVLLSFYFMCSYDPSIPWMRQVDELLSGRLNLANLYYRAYSFNLFGRSFSEILLLVGTQKTVMIDNSYVNLLIVFGVVPTAIYLIGYLTLFLHAIKIDALSACVFGAFVYACVGFTECLTIDFAMNYCLIGIAIIYDQVTEASGSHLRSLDLNKKCHLLESSVRESMVCVSTHRGGR